MGDVLEGGASHFEMRRKKRGNHISDRIGESRGKSVENRQGRCCNIGNIVVETLMCTPCAEWVLKRRVSFVFRFFIEQ